MSPLKIMMTCVLLAAPLGAVAEPPACIGSQWSAAFLAKYPKAPAVCQGIETKDGVKYAKFYGRVTAVQGDVVHMDMLNTARTAVANVPFNLADGFKVEVNTKPTEPKDLQPGDNMTFWVREGQFGLAWSTVHQGSS